MTNDRKMEYFAEKSKIIGCKYTIHLELRLRSQILPVSCKVNDSGLITHASLNCPNTFTQVKKVNKLVGSVHYTLTLKEGKLHHFRIHPRPPLQYCPLECSTIGQCNSDNGERPACFCQSVEWLLKTELQGMLRVATFGSFEATTPKGKPGVLR